MIGIERKVYRSIGDTETDEDIEALFSAEPITDPLLEREKTAKIEKSDVEKTDLWLFDDDIFIFKDGHVIVYSEKGMVHISPGLIYRIYRSLERRGGEW